MRRHGTFRLGILAVIAAGATLAAGAETPPPPPAQKSAPAATVVNAVSESVDLGSGERVFTLRFTPALPPFEITGAASDPSVAFDAAPAEDMVRRAGLESTAGRTRLRLGAAGVRIASIRTGANSLEIRLADAPASVDEKGYRIGPNDMVGIQVYKNADISGDYSVGPDGTVSLPLVGSVLASGLSEKDLTDRLRERLAEFLVDPQVSVSVKTYQSQYVYVAGSVPRAARVALKPGMAVNDILSEAGVGLLPGQLFTVTRRGDAAPYTTLDSATTDAGRSPVLHDGDVITVMEPMYVYVEGEVRQQGRFPLTTGMTMLQAIAVAGGLTDWASKKELRILREVGGEKRELTVDMRKVETRKVEDPVLQPGDYILVKRRIL
jgi:protein involved in polysaccharide export with SLBB domain